MHQDYPIRPVCFTEVRLSNGFWSPRLETNRAVTIPYCFQKCEEYGRIDNFALAAGLKTGEHRGRYTFDDTDVYKLIEAAAYSLRVRPDPDLERHLDRLIDLIAAAQEPDGYLFTARTNKARYLASRAGEDRWTYLLKHSHELYNLGHLYEAAVAHHLATGKRTLLDVALKSADLVEAVFGPGKNERPICHQIIEMALIRLYRVTGDPRRLRLAKYILDARGKNGEVYTQDHLPVTAQHEAVGHAVRAMYMYSGMTDIAAMLGEESYRAAVDRLWTDVVGRHLYVTGGIGSQPNGESFGPPYELPNASGYCETCAAIGLVFWSHRLYLLYGDACYLDVLERALYNGVLPGVSMTGDRFFYPNPLESFGEYRRSEWFGCACCPGNVARLIPSVPGYAFAVRGGDVDVNLYMQGEARVATDFGRVVLRTETCYPWDGHVRIAVEPEAEREFAVRLRIPGWARGEPVPSDLYRYSDDTQGCCAVCLVVNGHVQAPAMEKGFAVVRRRWRAGDTVALSLPMPVRRVVARASVQAAGGRGALERGPIVYCAEWPDQPGGRVLHLVLPDDAKLTTAWDPALLGGVQVIDGQALAARRGAGDRLETLPQPFRAIPYYAWNHRGAGEMAVWLPRSEAAARPLAAGTLAQRAAVTLSPGADACPFLASLVARHPDVAVNRLFHWKKDEPQPQWVEFRFDGPVAADGVEVYWFDDTDNEDVPFPASWRILYEAGGAWLAVKGRGPYEGKRHVFNAVEFDPVSTCALRIEVTLPPAVSGGILEARIREATAC
jgi:uncharacterized protein